MTDKENTKLSKFLSLVLRHQPELIGIVLDNNGWVDLKLLIAQANKNDIPLSIEVVKHLVATNPKKRFSINESGDKIRANQGHSVVIDLGYASHIPPAILYHGTSKSNVSGILKTGIEKRARHHVHLSADIETALKVGQRHGQPVVVEVFSGEMEKEGFAFFLSDNDVWLTETVPLKFLRILSEANH